MITSAEGKGAIERPQRPLARRRRLAELTGAQSPAPADLILAVGTRLALAVPKADQQVIHIDIDPDEIGRNHRKTLGLVGDARATLDALVEGFVRPLPRAPRARPSARHCVQRRRRCVQEPQAGILKSLREGTPEDAIFIAGMTQIGYYSRPCWPMYQPRTYLVVLVLGQSRLRISGGPRRQGGLPDRGRSSR